MAAASLAAPFGLTGARRVVAIAAAAIVLTFFFVVIGFPYDRILPRVEQGIAAAIGQPLRIGRFALGAVWFVPQLRAWDVDATSADGRRLHFDRVRVRPALSFAWLRGSPALVVALRSKSGELDGTVTLGAEPGFQGEIRQVQLSQLPIDVWAPGTSLDGLADAEVDLTFAEAGPSGSVKLAAKQGSLALPLLPIGVPFDTLSGKVELGGDVLASIDALELEGPLVSLSVAGSIGSAPAAAAAPLSLRAKLAVRDTSLRSLIASQGVALDANGEAQLEIGGTLGEPQPQSVRKRGAPQ